MRDLTFTYDLEDTRPSADLPQRFDETTRRVLECLDELGVKGTFFIVGTAAQTAPAIVRAIADGGHEVALHSWDHVMLPQQNAMVFRKETDDARALLQDLAQQPVVGYRAPNFSLTRESVWAVDVLGDLGFEYSSSVLPVSHPYFGFPGVPKTTFRWANGLLEFPAPVGRFGPKQLPFLGGIYFRFLPRSMVLSRAAAAKADALWFYSHPHDFDDAEAFFRIRNISWSASALLWFRRKGAVDRMISLLSEFTVLPPFAAQIAAGCYASVNRWDGLSDDQAGGERT
ncbi:MAG: polysaccharide deacetylase family protein [Proteobacteria bacterium]|nr:polysaccharide deacetylase family protein [Pseudomonadota bacterium]